jgi:uncharacterized membrane protein
MANKIYASFNDPMAAERAVGAMLDHGVQPEDVSVIQSHEDPIIQPENGVEPGMGFAPIFGYSLPLGSAASPIIPIQPLDLTYGDEAGEYETPPPAKDSDIGDYKTPPENFTDTSGDTEATAKQGITTTTLNDAAEGAKKGSLWGAGVGIVAGLAALVIPGAGLVYGGGALALALTGAAASAGAGAAAGALTGFLVDQGVDAPEAQEYARTIHSGGAVLEVNVPSGDVSEEEVRTILLKYGSATIKALKANRYLL